MESSVESGSLLASLVHPVGCDFVWGLKNVVQAVSAAQLWNYRWLTEDVTPKPKTILPSRHGYSVSRCRNICNRLLWTAQSKEIAIKVYLHSSTQLDVPVQNVHGETISKVCNNVIVSLKEC